MPTHNFAAPRGRFEHIDVQSAALAANLLGDPDTRRVTLYVPEGVDPGCAPVPLFVDLAAFTSSGMKRLAWTAFGESVPQRIDRLRDEGRLGDAIFAFPDAFTSIGGNQYIDSAAVGLWETFIYADMLPAIESRVSVHREGSKRALFGKSSGGYGALVHGLRHPGQWGAVACHSGDMAFDLLYAREFPALASALASYGGDPAKFFEACRDNPQLRGSDFHTLMMLGMAATYDPDPDAAYGLRLPFDPHTCEVDPEAWSRWLRHDPLVLLEAHADALRSLRLLFIDVGTRDQYYLQYGARRLARALERRQVAHRYEEFDGTHSGIDHRLDVSLPALWSAVSGS